MNSKIYLCKSNRFGCLFFLLWPVVVSGTTSLNSMTSLVSTFKKSDIFIMYNSNDATKLSEYKVDNISWGSQVHIYPKAIEKNNKILSRNMDYGIKLSSVDIALIQEGGKYVLCGNKWNYKCDKFYWDLRKKTSDADVQKLSELKAITERAVLDVHGKIVGVPWVSKGGVTIPMARTNDLGYKKWLIEKIDGVLKIKPDAIHFDEPGMESVAINSKRPFGLNQYNLQEFNKYLAKLKGPDWKYDNIQHLDKFDYKKLVLDESDKKRNFNLPLWKEFTEFKVASSVKLFGELVTYAKGKSGGALQISANVALGDWRVIPLIQYIDFIASEVGHQASKFKVPSQPLYIYKLAEGFNKPIVSTALGADWAVIKKDKHILLACTWIAQAYATGQYMNFPLKAWVPGSTYQPLSNIYPQLSSWIKEQGKLFDGYESINSTGVLFNVEVLKNHKKVKKLIQFILKLIKKGVLFKIILDDSDKSIIAPSSNINDFRSLIILFPEYISAEKNRQLKKLYPKDNIWWPTQSDMDGSIIKSGLSQISILGANGIYAFPRRKQNRSGNTDIIHLLNRDYLPERRKMEQKGPFKIKLNKGFLNNINIKSAILHQPKLTGDENFVNLDVPIKLSIKEIDNYLILTVPTLNLWGIIEFKYF